VVIDHEILPQHALRGGWIRGDDPLADVEAVVAR